MTLFAQENWINITENCGQGDSDVYETGCETRPELYRAMQQQYGRCIGKVYIDAGKPVGWIFHKRQKYDDCNKTYLQETWVTVHSGPPTKTIKYHYAD